MRIVIDLQGMQTGSRFRGIGRYTESLTKSIIQNNNNHEIILLLFSYSSETIDTVKKSFKRIVPNENIKICYVPNNIYEMNRDNLWKIKASEIIRESFIYNLQPDFLLISTLFEGYGEDFVCSINESYYIPTATIFYDLIPLMNKEKYLADKYVNIWYMNKVKQCSNSQLLLTISESARKEAIDYLDFEEDNIINISTATDGRFKKTILSLDVEKRIRKKFRLDKKFLMYSGATDERKNHLRLIEAFSLLPQKLRGEFQLAFVGGMPEDHRKKLIDYGKNFGLSAHNLILTGIVTDKEMNYLYNMCEAFIFPSWHEGFGLPALEAMQCGKAVIASNTSSLPEVIGREDALFDPFDVQSIKSKIIEVLTDKNFRNSLETHAKNQTLNFSWDITAKRAISAMEKFHSEHTSQAKKTSIDDLISNIANIDISYTEKDLLEVSECIFKNNYKKKLFIDISELVRVDHGSGIQRVTKNILSNLLKIDTDKWQIQPVYASEDKGYWYANNFINHFLNISSNNGEDFPINYDEGDIFLCLDMSPPINIAHKYFYKDLINKNVKVFFFVHDILPILFPFWWEEGVSENFSEWLEIVMQSNGVICVSNQTATDLKNFIIKENPKILNDFHINVSHNGADIYNSNPSTGLPKNACKTLNRLKETKSFLMVGTIEPRKGHKQTLLAFEMLLKSNEDINLVIVGKEGWMMEDFIMKLKNHPELNKRLFWLEDISDEYLLKIYEASDCLVMASEAEGFGLPLIEAAQHKLPIIARDIPVFREVAGDFAYYFKNTNEPSLLKEAIKDWLELYKNDKHPKSDDMPWLTWEESTKNLLDIILDAKNVEMNT